MYLTIKNESRLLGHIQYIIKYDFKKISKLLLYDTLCPSGCAYILSLFFACALQSKKNQLLLYDTLCPSECVCTLQNSSSSSSPSPLMSSWVNILVARSPDQWLSIQCMVFIFDGCSFRVAHVWCKQGLFPEKIGFDYSFDVIKCLQEIEMPDLLHMWA